MFSHPNCAAVFPTWMTAWDKFPALLLPADTLINNMTEESSQNLYRHVHSPTRPPTGLWKKKKHRFTASFKREDLKGILCYRLYYSEELHCLGFPFF